MPECTEDPIVTFYQIYPDAPPPRRADSSVFGSLPTKATHYCEPVTAASGFGWYLFPPIDFSLLWDGSSVLWRPGDADAAGDWRHLPVAVLPGFAEHFRRFAGTSEQFREAPPFLLAPGDLPGIVQIWTGVLARTRPGWSVLIRPPANLARHSGYDVFDGIIESDWWFGPLISNVRLCMTGQPIVFRTGRPLFQVQPVPQAAYRNDTLNSARVMEGVASLTADDWRDYEASLRLRNNPEARRGSYKAEVRRRERGVGE